MSNRLLTISELLETIKRMKTGGASWGKIAKELYPNEDQKKIRPLLWRIFNERYYPKRNDLRSRLRLPRLVEIEACPDCNEVHTDRCPKVNIEDLPSYVKMIEIPACAIHGIVHCYDCTREIPRPIPKPRKPRVDWRASAADLPAGRWEYWIDHEGYPE